MCIRDSSKVWEFGGEGGKELAAKVLETLEHKESNFHPLYPDEKMCIRDRLTLDNNKNKYRIQLLTIIGEIEGHECLPSNSKTTKYEHVLPRCV